MNLMKELVISAPFATMPASALQLRVCKVMTGEY